MGAFSSCIDGCKSSYKEDICIKSNKGKTMTVQSKCHYQCYEEYQGYSYAHHGKCKDSSKPSEFDNCIDGCKDKYEENHCIKSKDGKRITVQSKCHYYCYEKYQGYSLEHSGKCKDSSKPSAFGSCIDGCKSNYKEDICIKSDKGKTMTVQSKCHYQCYEEYQGYSYAHHGKCKDSSKPSEFDVCIDGCKDKYKEDHCIKSKDGKRINVQSKCHYYCYEKYQGYSYAHHGKCKDSPKPSEFDNCIDGCKGKYEENHCIKSKNGKSITVQSKCHYYCYEKYHGYSLEHSGKCKDSSKPSAFGSCIDGCKSSYKEDICIKSDNGKK